MGRIQSGWWFGYHLRRDLSAVALPLPPSSADTSHCLYLLPLFSFLLPLSACGRNPNYLKFFAMARSAVLVLLLVAIFLAHSSLGSGRRVKVLRHPPGRSLLERGPEIERVMREMVTDYKEPGPNTNPRGGSLINIPPPLPPAPYVN
ncbi:hypothetical protein AXF42_Ash003306 [Apostasia shenzhenica]|uniref:Uncharacterized protein n=1 Tax=Apostasia shenzhenica TaxID=1088818 RepID=A0A2I0BFT2_9ASPA|nr:hypothetical protein AXF42_Ash003306 [Apostasia shenzhenica]